MFLGARCKSGCSQGACWSAPGGFQEAKTLQEASGVSLWTQLAPSGTYMDSMLDPWLKHVGPLAGEKRLVSC